MESNEKQRLIRHFAAALISSKLSVGEIERFRKLIASDPVALDLLFESTIASLRSLLRPQELGTGPASEKERLSRARQIDEVCDLVNLGLVPKEKVLQAIYLTGVLDMSISAMRKMSTRALIERATESMKRMEAKRFLDMLRTMGSEDSYLKGIERKRGS